MRSLGAVCLALTIVLATPAAGQQRRENGWSERGLFVFGAYVFDFWRGFSGPSGSHVISHLEDCSTGDFYCLREQWFTVVLPRTCGEVAVGDTWTVGATTTRVIARVPMIRGIHDVPAEDHAFAIATDGYNTVFLYDGRRGVRSIYQGWPFHTSERAAEQATRYSPEVPRRDARALAEEGRLLDDNSGFHALGLMSPDAFGPCQEGH
jgi:hypothetical protein